MDLFTPVVPTERQHPNFRPLTSVELMGPERAVLEAWSSGFQDRDGKFVTEFQTTFNSSFWELYLFAAFREMGCTVDFRHYSPDFVLSSPIGDFVAEATIASHPDGYSPEWERRIDLDAVFQVNREELLTVASIRLSNAITAKHRKYQSHYAKLPHVTGKPYVICVAPFDQPFFFLQNDLALRRVLYGFDRHLYEDDPEAGTRAIFGATTIDSVKKDNGSGVPMGLFSRPGMEEVSAVIFSNTATFTKVRALAGEGPYPVICFGARYDANSLEPMNIELPRPHFLETTLDGLHFCINPFAANPLNPSFFAHHGAALHSFDPTTHEYISWAPDGFLFQHACISFAPENLTSKFRRELAPADAFKRPRLLEFPEGQMVPLGGEVLNMTDHQLTQYRGWTILVAKDMVDNDWGGQAVRDTCRSLTEFQVSNKALGYLPPRTWHASAEEALDEMKRRIGAQTAT